MACASPPTRWGSWAGRFGANEGATLWQAQDVAPGTSPFDKGNPFTEEEGFPGKKGAAAVLPEEKEGRIRISMDGVPGAVHICTGPYPQFPTDLQSPFMAALACGQGTSRVEEQVFEARFAAARALRAFGARISIREREAVVEGVRPLMGAQVMAPDLRGGAALAVAGLAAEGETRIGNCRHIERGYEDICRDLSALGARIRWVKEDGT